MFVEILTVMAPVVLIAALGFFWDRKGMPFDTNMVATLVTSIGAPCLIVSTLLENRPDPETISTMGFAALCVVGSVACVSAIGLKLTGQSIRAFLPALTFPNAGNMGIPLCLFAFGEEGLALSVSFFAVTALTQFTLGISIAAGRLAFRDVVTNPVLWSAVIAFVLLVTDSVLPRWIDGTIDVFAGLVIPLMLMSLGISPVAVEAGLFDEQRYVFAGASDPRFCRRGWNFSPFGFWTVLPGRLLSSSRPCRRPSLITSLPPATEIGRERLPAWWWCRPCCRF